MPPEWIDRYNGRFDQGWDALREQTFARQKTLGVIPPDCELTARPDEIPAWDEQPDELKPVLAREMEIYAAFLEHADHHERARAASRRGWRRTPHRRLLSERWCSAATRRRPRD